MNPLTQVLLDAGLSKHEIQKVLHASKITEQGWGQECGASIAPDAGAHAWGSGAINNDTTAVGMTDAEEAREWARLLSSSNNGSSAVGSTSRSTCALSNAGSDASSAFSGNFGGLVVLHDPSGKQQPNNRYGAFVPSSHRQHASGAPKPRSRTPSTCGAALSSGAVMPIRRTTSTGLPEVRGASVAPVPAHSIAGGRLSFSSGQQRTVEPKGIDLEGQNAWRRAHSMPLTQLDRKVSLDGGLDGEVMSSSLSCPKAVVQGARSNSATGEFAISNSNRISLPPTSCLTTASRTGMLQEALSFKHMVHEPYPSSAPSPPPPGGLTIPSPRPPRSRRVSFAGSNTSILQSPIRSDAGAGGAGSRAASLSPISTPSGSPFSSFSCQPSLTPLLESGASGLLGLSHGFGSLQRGFADTDEDGPVPRTHSSNELAAQSLAMQKSPFPALPCNVRSKLEDWLLRGESRPGSLIGAMPSKHASLAHERRSSSSGALGVCTASLMPSSNSSLIQRLKEAGTFAAASKDSVGSGSGGAERVEHRGPGTELPPSFKSYLAGIEARARRSSSSGACPKTPTSPLSRAGSSSLGMRVSESSGALHMMTHGY